MLLQIACLIGCKVTLLAFVWLSPLCFHMCPQNVCTRYCIVTLVAFVWTFLHCAFSNDASNTYPTGCRVALVALDDAPTENISVYNSACISKSNFRVKIFRSVWDLSLVSSILTERLQFLEASVKCMVKLKWLRKKRSPKSARRGSGWVGRKVKYIE